MVTIPCMHDKEAAQIDLQNLLLFFRVTSMDDDHMCLHGFFASRVRFYIFVHFIFMIIIDKYQF